MRDWSARLAAACERGGAPGAVLGVLHRGELTVVPHGVLSTRTGVEVTADSVFQVGSITKPWTATMVVQLVAEGRLTLDSTVADVLPGVRLGSAGHRAGEITVEHLLTHSSGLDGDVFTDTGRGDDCLERYVDLLDDVAQVHEVGAAYSYCNTGFVLLGRMVEVLDGRTWDESLRARISGPLGLDDVCTLPEEAVLRRAAVGHEGGKPVSQWALPRSLGPAGLVTTTAHDLLRFAGQWLDDDLAPQLRDMTRPRLDVPDGTDHQAVGLGWRVGHWGPHDVVGHSGNTIGQAAQLRMVPALDLALCLMVDGGRVDTTYEAVVPDLVEELTGVRLPAGAAPDPDAAPADLARHVGTYLRRAERYDVEADDDGLVVTLTPVGELAAGDPETVRLHPCDGEGDRFVARSEDADPWSTFTFSMLPDGTPQLFFAGRVAPLVED